MILEFLTICATYLKLHFLGDFRATASKEYSNFSRYLKVIFVNLIVNQIQKVFPIFFVQTLKSTKKPTSFDVSNYPNFHETCKMTPAAVRAIERNWSTTTVAKSWPTKWKLSKLGPAPNVHFFSVKPISLKISWKWFDEKRTLILCFEEGRCTCSVCVFMSICLIKLWVNSHFSFCRNFSWKRPWKIFFFFLSYSTTYIYY